MVIVDRLGKQVEAANMHDGQGTTLAYAFFEGQIDDSMMFFDLALKPGTYVGYHRHEGHDEIIYVMSGEAESYHNGELHTLKAGDAILVRAGEAHAARNTGNGEFKVLGMVATPGNTKGSVENLPLPDPIADWKK